MSDIFLKSNAVNLLKGKHVVIFGDSNMRCLYKDLLWLLNKNTLIDAGALKKKLEPSFEGDSLVRWTALHKGRDFEEVRHYKRNNIEIEFLFITRCHNSMIEELITQVNKKIRSSPDIIIMNSCLWDITRWGPNGVTNYKDNMVKLMRLFKSSLPPETLVIWTTAPPVSTSCYGALLISQVEFLKHTLRFEVMEANMFCRQIVVAHGFDVLDVHHHLRMQIHRRAKDGIHWQPTPMRHITNLLLTHISLSWNVPLPGNFNSPSLEAIKKLENEEKTEIVFPNLPFGGESSGSSTKAKLVKSVMKAPSRPPLKRKPRKKVKPRSVFVPMPNLNKENVHPVPCRPVCTPVPLASLPVCPPLMTAQDAVEMYNKYGEPVYVSKSYYGMVHGGWRTSLTNKFERRFTPYQY